MEDFPKRQIDVPLNGAIVKRHPQRLHRAVSSEEVEANLGAPDATATGFNGDQPLTWVGATHKLDAFFTSGRLYALSLENRASGHSVTVNEPMDLWGP